MASGLTNTGKMRILEMAFRNGMDSAAIDTSPYFIALATSAATLTALTELFDTTVQIAVGSGYADGGISFARDSATWDILAMDTVTGYGYIRLKDIVWTAAGGSIPASGGGAMYALITDDNALVGSRKVYGWIDLTTARSIGNGATLTLQDIELRIT